MSQTSSCTVVSYKLRYILKIFWRQLPSCIDFFYHQVYGSGKQTRSFQYIRLVSGLLLAFREDVKLLITLVFTPFRNTYSYGSCCIFDVAIITKEFITKRLICDLAEGSASIIDIPTPVATCLVPITSV